MKQVFLLFSLLAWLVCRIQPQTETLSEGRFWVVWCSSRSPHKVITPGLTQLLGCPLPGAPIARQGARLLREALPAPPRCLLA